MRILVIEDNRMNLKLAASILSSGGHEVYEAMDAENGVELAREEQPDLILMDIQLPAMDGLEATRLLKTDATTRHIKVLAVTACAMRGDRENILAAGCDGYLAKPYRPSSLLDLIEIHAGAA